MLNVARLQQSQTLILRLSGEIDERVDLEKSIGPTASDTVLSCAEVLRVNSLGVKAWIRFFQSRVALGTRLRFIECSPAVVEQLSLIMSFACGGKIESIYVPFACVNPDCKTLSSKLFDVEALRKASFILPEVLCPACGSKTLFDHLHEEYFRFALRQS